MMGREDEREVQSDAISQRMDRVIDQMGAIRSETVTPHWEVFEETEGNPTIYHLHGATKVPASVSARKDGERVAECTECKEQIDLGGAGSSEREREDARSA
jgi:hypothetical protein